MVMESEIGLPDELADQIRSGTKTFVESLEEGSTAKKIEEWQSMTDDLEWVLKCVDENVELCSKCNEENSSGSLSPVLKICRDARQTT